MELLGQLAALGTSVLWSIAPIFFTEAGRLIGSFRANHIRLLQATCLYLLALPFVTGHLFPPGISSSQLFWLVLSGLVGLVLGDSWGFKALVMIGPRLTTLLRSTTPIMTTIIAWFMLDEQLKAIDLLGIALTVGGVAWVISERQFAAQAARPLAADHPDAGSLFKGVLLGLGAAAGQAAGLVMSKHAMLDFESTLDAMPSSFVRIVSAMLMLWIFTGLRGRLPDVVRTFRDRKAMLFALGGAVTGPFVAVTLSLVAVKYLDAGIAATLASMAPILVIPIVVVAYKERVSLRAIFGALLAFFGVALLFVGDDLLRFILSF